MVSHLLFCFVATAMVAAPEETGEFDRAVNAFCLLGALRERPITPTELKAILPARHRLGYSMEDLLNAGARLGLPLEPLRLPPGARAPDRPMIVYLKDIPTGHFAVIRPVGITGKMIQVLDPPHAPRITDFSAYSSTLAWTGRALAPRRFAWSPWLLGVSVAGLSLGAAVGLRSRRSGRRRPEPV